ncbi:MAG: hypothetical protein J0M24_22890 [Verrucomicrobia bacterium]|nr:hypothetical protein [Verrucomicrobiota bacterium]
MYSLFAAGWGPLIPFIVFFFFLTLSLLHTLYKRSQRGDRSEHGDWPSEPLNEGDEVTGGRVVGRYERPNTPVPSPYSPTETRPLSPWEAELERVLRRETPVPAPPPPVLPLPTSAPWIPPSPMTSAQTTVEELTAADLEAATLATESQELVAATATSPHNGFSLQDRVQGYLHGVEAQVRNPALRPAPVRVTQTPELAAFVASLRNPASARQAILASLVLEPPKALQS